MKNTLKNTLSGVSLILTAFLMLSFSGNIQGQDMRFSQYYATPTYLNPSLTGAYQGSFRVSGIYRDQWRGAYNEPLQTFAISGDARFKLDGSKRSQNGDALAGGFLFLTDRTSYLDFNTTFIGLSMAFHKLLNKRKSTYLSFGTRFSMVNKSINFENATFHDQFNGIDEFIFVSNEALPFNSFTYPDLGIGINFSSYPEERKHFSAGLSFEHITRSNVSFYQGQEEDPNEPIEREVPLFSKFAGDAQYTFPIARKSQLGPRASFHLQGPFMEASLGSIYRYYNPARSGFGIQVGAWARGNNYLDTFQPSTAVMMFGVELGSTFFALSYESNIGEIAYLFAQNSFEISVSYTGEFSNDVVFCPRF